MARNVLVFTSGAYALNSGVVLGGTSAAGDDAALSALLVDPALFPGDLDRIATFLEATSHDAARVLLTHSDWDHVVGAGRFAGAAVVASALYPGRVETDGPRIVRALEEFDRKLYVVRKTGFTIPSPDTLVGSPSELVWSGPSARLIPARGHTPDGLMLLLRTEHVLFAGDYLSDREIPFVGDSVGAYLDTLASVRALLRRSEVEILVPGHGDVCGCAEIEARIDEDSDYLARLASWVRETRRTVDTVDGLIERCDEIVFRKGYGNPDVHAEHRSNVAVAARALGMT